MTSVILLVALALPATAPAPTASRVPAAQLSQQQHRQLHVEAYELMIVQEFDKAAEPFDKVYNATPADKRTRPLVVNRAILDLVQKKFAMRGVRDLSAYLTRHREADEEATNILGSLLDFTANDPKLKKSPLWQSAFKEWDRRNYVLDHSRKGYRRWGARWLTDDEYKQIEAEREALKADLAAQMDVVNRCVLRLNSLIQQQKNAADNAQNYAALARTLAQIQTNPTATVWMPPAPAPAPGQAPIQGGPMSTFQPNFVGEYMYSASEAQRLYGECGVAVMELQQEQAKLRKLDRVIKPKWPTDFAPVNPDGPAATQPAGQSPFQLDRPPAAPKPGQLYPEEPAEAPATKPAGANPFAPP